MEEEQHDNREITALGYTDWRNEHRRFGIKDKDRLRHLYVLGMSGTGKTTLLQNMAISDIQKGKGVAVIDPHGDVSDSLLDYIPEERIPDVIYFNAADVEYPIGFNPLNGVDVNSHHLVASNLVSTFKKVWADSWGARLEYILKFSILTLLTYPEATLLDIQPLLTDATFRNRVLGPVTNPHILAFWRNEFEKYHPTFRAEAIAPILNKMGVFLTSLPLKNIIGQSETSFRMRDILDGKKILIANLSKGRIGEDGASLLGSMLISAIQFAATSRTSIPETLRTPFYLYIDEAHSFLTLATIDILAEARKYGLSLFLTHQYLAQIDERIREALFGNCGTVVSFRIGSGDAEHLAKVFYPLFNETDLINLPNYSFYLKLLIDGAVSKPFSATSVPLMEISQSKKLEIELISQKQFGRHIHQVEHEITQRSSAVPTKRLTLFE